VSEGEQPLQDNKTCKNKTSNTVCKVYYFFV